ncbi:hypothetical protein ABFA07_002617 [Porites harrisoni]
MVSCNTMKMVAFRRKRNLLTNIVSPRGQDNMVSSNIMEMVAIRRTRRILLKKVQCCEDSIAPETYFQCGSCRRKAF